MAATVTAPHLFAGLFPQPMATPSSHLLRPWTHTGFVLIFCADLLGFPSHQLHPAAGWSQSLNVSLGFTHTHPLSNLFLLPVSNELSDTSFSNFYISER